jgi:hypothetical protein
MVRWPRCTPGGLVRSRPDITTGPRIEVGGRVPLAQLTDGTVLAVVTNRLVEIDPDERGTIATEVRAGGRTAIGLLARASGRPLLLGDGSAIGGGCVDAHPSRSTARHPVWAIEDAAQRDCGRDSRRPSSGVDVRRSW